MTVFTMDELYHKMYNLKLEIRNILSKSQRTWNEPRGQIEYDTSDPELNQQYKEFTDMFEELEAIANRIDLLNKPIKATSVLHKNSNNRYEDDIQEYSCGMGIEVFIPGDKPRWDLSRVEATADGRYYIVGHWDLEMEGLQTRYRERSVIG